MAPSRLRNRGCDFGNRSKISHRARWGSNLGERDADALVAAPDPTVAADELVGLDFKRE
jgi:hypothetical protein